MKLDRILRFFAWRTLFQMMMAPAAILVPLSVVATTVTFAVIWGRPGAACGVLGGLVLGIVLLVFWYTFVIGTFTEAREKAALERIGEEVTRERIGRPTRTSERVEPIPIEIGGAGQSSVDISGEVSAAVERIRARAATDPEDALRAAEALRSAHPREAAAIGVGAELLRDAKKTREALVRAGEAIHVGVLRAELDAAADVLRRFWSEREELVLEPSIASALAKHFEAVGDPERAEWLAKRERE